MLSKKDQTKSNRIKPKKATTFGVKKPFKGKCKNRKGALKKSIEANKINPIEDMNLFDKSITVRFDKKELQRRVYFVLNLNDGVCQVCESSRDLDYPHHTKQGSKKDDRYMINICCSCHDILHRVGFETLNKTREELKVIGWYNHLKYMESIK